MLVSPRKNGLDSSFEEVRAEIITELILERVGPVILKTFFTGIKSFQTDPSNLSCKKSKPENYWKR